MVLSIIISLLFCWAYVTFCHEAAHALVGRFKYGFPIKGFYPYWNWMNIYTGEVRMWNPLKPMKDPFNGDGDFAFGRYIVFGDFPRGKHELVHIAPVLADGLNIVAAVCLLLASSMVVFPVVLICCSLVDASLFVKGYFGSKQTLDGYKWRHGIEF